jgi:hypothetical protein
VLADGSIQFEFADGTTRRQPAPAPAGGGSTPTTAGDPADVGIVPVEPPVWLTDPATNRAFLEAMTAYYAYRASGLEHRRRVFQWQLLSSKIIFVTVLMLVASGILFAAIQFRAGLKRKDADARDAATEIDLSTSSLKVSSPVLGVIILVISLAFFYLYLVYVYPISELI